MVNSKGVDTSILFGFTKYLLELIDREKPTHLAVAFDPPGGTFRDVLYPDYKANRPPTPQLVIDALEPLTEIVRAMNIPVLMVRGFEADDVIGSMAVRSAAEGLDVFMVTPDKDYGQLITPHITQVKPGKGGGDDEIVDVAAVCARYGIDSPLQVIDLLTICGDASDNVPGVKGVGEVGAGKLISKYGSVDGIYAHLDELTPRQRGMFEEAADHIGLSRTLVTIKTDIPIDVQADDMVLNMDYSPAIADIFEKYEFNSLRKHIMHVAAPAAPGAGEDRLLCSEVAAPELRAAALQAGCCAIAAVPDGEGIFAPIAAVTVVARASDGSGRLLCSRGPLSGFADLLSDGRVCKYGIDLKYQSNILSHAGVALSGKLMDVELMHYLLNPERSHSLDILARSYLGAELVPPPPDGSMGSLFADDDALVDDYSRRTAAALLVGEAVAAELAQAGLKDLYDRIEEPLIGVLGRMERNGVAIDLGSLKDFADELRNEMQKKEAQVREIAGDASLNVSSPKQVGTLIFEKLQLDPKARKGSKGSWSTDEETLLSLADRSPVIDAILDYRAARKLLSTYIEPFPGYISAVDGRVHTTFNQALTATGRLSSSSPNLQNIPVRTDRGRTIRRAFCAQTPGHLIMSADYSQIELRIMAHLSCDEHLVNAFRRGEDVHAATASRIFGIPMEEVTSDQRRIAKTANFGIMYGISAFGLSQRLRCSRTEAKQIIDDYFASFPAIRSFIDDTLTMARETGYVETIFGRRRYVPELASSNATVRSIAERNAVNAPIQGSSADIIKLAMVSIDTRMREAGLRARMVLQIHDELLFELDPSELEALREIVVGEMENVVELSVPLTVDCNYGTNWLDSHQ